jgi:transposase
VADIRQLEQRIAVVEARIKAAVAQVNTSLLGLFGVGPVLAATFMGEVGDIGRFPTKYHFAAHTGTAPLEASSGAVVRHRLSRAGDRKLNHGQVAQGSAAVPEATALGCRLPLSARRSARPTAPGATAGFAANRRAAAQESRCSRVPPQTPPAPPEHYGIVCVGEAP